MFERVNVLLFECSFAHAKIDKKTKPSWTSRQAMSNDCGCRGIHDFAPQAKRHGSKFWVVDVGVERVPPCVIVFEMMAE